MNMNKFLFASMILAGMTACSKEDIASENNESGSEMEGAAYMSLSISMPKGNGSRATDAGTEDEQTVSNLSIYIWDRNNQLLKDKEGKFLIYNFNGNELRPNKPNDPTSDNNTTVYTTAPIAVQKSEVYKVAVIVNGSNGKKGIQTLDANVEPTFLRNQYEIKNIKTITTPKSFLMTNATTTMSQTLTNKVYAPIKTTVPTQEQWGDKNGTFFPDGTVGVNITGTKANPTSVIIPVERSVAKLAEMTAKNHGNLSFSLQNKDSKRNDKVDFQKVALVNANTKFFFVKNLASIDGKDMQYTTNNESNIYVIDPNFANQNSNEDFLFTQFETSTTTDKQIKWEVMKSATTDSNIFYTLENTMIAAEQMNAYTTGFYYEAKYTLDETKKQSEHVYKFAGKLYTYETLKEVKDLNLTDYPDDASIEKFEEIGVTKYENGICYYPYWIRHINNPESLAPMEFGVVRNNYYQMHVQSVKEIGFNKPVNPDPNTPDEDPDTMLEVLVKVMPWTVRNNGIDF